LKRPTRVINVIGAEQRLAQIHVKAALYALGKHNYADNLTHFAFGLVEMPGYKMSSRRGRLVTLDSVITESVKRAELEVEKRSEKLREDEKRKIAETIAISAVKYALVSVDPSKTVVFTWDRVLSLEKNSAPFINYAYTRAVGILNKAPSLKATPDFKLLRHPLEKALILRVAMFPEVFEEAAEKLRPENLATYSNELAEIFHEYYEKVNVIRAENEDLRSARTGLVRAVKIVLENAMSLLGVNLTPKM
jgi:arginyl-tRNA synthetase